MIRIITGVLAAAAVLIPLSIVGGSFYVVEQGERAVVLRNGKRIEVSEPGLHFKLPFVDSVRTIDVRDKAQAYENVLSYSFDQQTAALTVSITYSIPEGSVGEVFDNYGTEENLLNRLVERKLFASVKNVFGRWTAAKAIQDRAKLTAEIQTAVQEAVDGPVTITSVQIENIDFSRAYEESVEQRMLAEVEVQKLRQNAEREKVQAEITVTKAKAEADAKLAQAQADAQAIRARGEAEADAIRNKGAALRDNPSLIDLTAVERWSGTLPSTMVPGASLPFVNVK